MKYPSQFSVAIDVQSLGNSSAWFEACISKYGVLSTDDYTVHFMLGILFLVQSPFQMGDELPNQSVKPLSQ